MSLTVHSFDPILGLPKINPDPKQILVDNATPCPATGIEKGFTMVFSKLILHWKRLYNKFKHNTNQSSSRIFNQKE